MWTDGTYDGAANGPDDGWSYGNANDATTVHGPNGQIRHERHASCYDAPDDDATPDERHARRPPPRHVHEAQSGTLWLIR